MGEELDPETHARIEVLLRELRGWHPGVPERTLEQLVRLFNLPELVVSRLADSEGFDLRRDGTPTYVDPTTTTQPIEIKK
jgi:hypothetical protein